jgi:ABC-2 type transport system permease protein
MRFANIFLKAISDRKASWPTFAISVSVYVLMICGIYNSFAGLKGFSELIKSYPKGFLSLLAGSSSVDMMSPAGFISVEFLQLWGMIIVAGFAISVATSIVAKEVDGHTMDLILTEPIDRVEYITARVCADLVMILALVVVTGASMWAGTKWFDFPLKGDGILAVSVLLFSVYVMIECFALLAGTFMERGRAVIVCVTVLIVSHLINGLADLNDTIANFRWMSFFNYYKPAEVLNSGAIPWPQILLFISLGLIFFIAAIVIFREKDIPS